jgi:bifunctional UDP-N-acetylglucosamine pyrophosphorylase/glucosamine-1-phosphate N-acetyltransferase
MTEAAPGSSLSAIVLAAGLGTRMRSDVIKVLHRLGGRPMVEYPLRLLAPLGVTRTALVLGHQAEQVAAQLRERQVAVPDLRIALQAQQRGTADAVRAALPVLPPPGPGEPAERVLILYGDTPLLVLPRLQELLRAAEGRKLALLATTLTDPHGYGRLLRSASGAALRIVEDRDCDAAQRAICEINAGIYVADGAFLRATLQRVVADNAQRELYLTDLVALAVAQGDEVAVVSAPPEEVLGVNDRIDLATAEALLRRRINEEHQRAGVTLRDPATTYIDDEVTIGRDTELGPAVSLRGRCVIGTHCRIDVGAVLTDVTVADGTRLAPYAVASGTRLS